MKIENLFKILRKNLKQAGDAKKSPDMQRYMKSEMPYHGVMTPVRVEICKKVFSEISFADFEEWKNAVVYIWENAKFREEKYCALYLCGCKQARQYQTIEALAIYRELATDGAWWDYVDSIAAYVGQILKSDFAKAKPVILKWSKDKNIWARRLAILSQLSFKDNTDVALLYKCIEPSLGSDEFFLQKAIGWALRQYAWRNSKEVKRYIEKNKKRLSALSIREALKNVNKGKC